MLKRLLTAAAVSLAAITPQLAEAATEKKVALVVGNAAYAHATPLANPVTDARAMAAAFERLGFETVTGFDLDHNALRRTIREFTKKSRDADVTTFFYAGHGIAFDNKNYIIPIDAEFADETALEFEAVEVDFVIEQMRRSEGVSLVFLDACRDNPLAGTLARSMGHSTRSAMSRGLVGMDVQDAGKGLAIAFATAPGQVAYDGAEAHSPFTTALLEHIETAGTDIQTVMANVTGDVLKSTDERQRPWLNASLTGPVILKPAPVVAPEPLVTASLDPAINITGGTTSDATVAATTPAVVVAPSDVATQTQLFNLAHTNKDLRLYETYLTTFPNGIYAAVARQEIERLKAGTAAPQQVALADPTRTTTDPKAIVPTGPVLTPTAPVASGDPAVVPSPNAAAAPTPVPDFVITDAMKAEAGTKETEAAVGMNRTTRREVQTRLNLVEANVGGADGIFGPRTREGIAFWQGTHGMPETGFLTTAQVTALQGQTKVQYAEHVAAAQKAAKSRSRAAKKKSATRRATASRKKATKRRASTRRATKTRRVTKQRVVRRKNRSNRRHRHNPAASAAAGAFAGAVVGSIIGGAIRY